MSKRKNLNQAAPDLFEDDDEPLDDEQKKRLNFLLKKAEIFSHFVTNGTHAKNGEKGNENANKKLRTMADSKARYKKKADEKLVQFDKTPDYIQGEMRDYQVRGLNWLIGLYENGINGILGDEMGLGKTLQTISILGYLKHNKKIDGPFLVVAPLSTIHNWLSEVNRFCPSIRAFILHGPKPVRTALLRRLKKEQDTWDLCISTYEVCKIEIHSMQKPKWNYIVLDEGHKIKSEKTMVNKAMCSIKSNHRLMLTGTPLNNNLHEMWVLLNYLVPDVFASAHDFDTWFDSDDCLGGNNEIVKRLHIVLAAFMLRRIKADVEKSLLPKKEINLYIGLTPLQHETYTNVLQKKVKTINGLGEVSFKVIQQILMELRKVSNHPYLIDCVEPGPPYTTDQHLVDSCGKMQILDQLLAQLKTQGSRVVLFSQFVIVLDIIEDYLDWKGYDFRRLDGNTAIEKRVADINDFNAPNSEIFIYIISTRAGSLGINLATADTVIVYDSDWNPQMDFQAIDRVHRIGQKKQVHVYRLVTENTIDHRIVQRAAIKQRLGNLVIHNGQKAAGEPGKNEFVAMIQQDAEHIMTTNQSKLKFDLKKIIKESAQKDAAERAKLASMTLADSSSTSVYHFENVDFRAKAQNGKK